MVKNIFFLAVLVCSLCSNFRDVVCNFFRPIGVKFSPLQPRFLVFFYYVVKLCLFFFHDFIHCFLFKTITFNIRKGGC